MHITYYMLHKEMNQIKIYFNVESGQQTELYVKSKIVRGSLHTAYSYLLELKQKRLRLSCYMQYLEIQ